MLAKLLLNRAFTLYRQIKPRFTRELLFQHQNRARLAAEGLEKQKLDHIQKIFQMPENDRNPANLLKQVKIVAPLPLVYKLQTVPHTDFIPKFQHVKPDLVVRREYLDYSNKKTVLVAKQLRKKHVLDAIEAMKQNHKKASKYFMKSLYNAMDHAKHKGLDVNRLYIHRVLVARKLKHKKIRYHAKMKRGIAHHQQVTYRIQFKQMNKKEFFQRMVKGKVSASLAKHFRTEASSNDLSYEQVKKFHCLLTMRGRYAQRLRFQQKVYQLTSKGMIPVLAQRQVLAEEAPKMQALFGELNERINKRHDTLALREKMAKSNLKKQGLT